MKKSSELSALAAVRELLLKAKEEAERRGYRWREHPDGSLTLIRPDGSEAFTVSPPTPADDGWTL